MATIKAFIRTTSKKTPVNVRFRLSDGASVQLYHKSEFIVLPELWDEKREEYKARCTVATPERVRFNKSIAERRALLLSVYSSHKVASSSEFEALIDEALHPDKYSASAAGFFELWDMYLQKNKLSVARERNLLVLVRALKRYEAIRSAVDGKAYILDVDKISADDISDIEEFLTNEHELYKEYPKIYASFPTSLNMSRAARTPEERGHNTICILLKKLRAFFNWCNKQDITTNRPFDKYSGSLTEKYGRVWYLLDKELRTIASFNLSATPTYEAQRDIFIFQCSIGCRVGDLMRLTPSNVVGDYVEYIPHKTAGERPEVVRVPLIATAKALIEKYRGVDAGGRLFPFISEQKYNYAIKDIVRACGISRIVTVMNPTTGKEEQKNISDLVSSHCARRSFIGNAYKKVKDPSLVGSMTGHKEGSRSFVRYRDIDDETKKDVVSGLDW
jgi:integrase